jgi:hypothetical protein
LSEQSESTQLGIGSNESESSHPPESLPPNNERKDSSTAGKIKVQKPNRALLEALSKLKSYPEWLGAQGKPNLPPSVRRVENDLPLVHKVMTGSSLPISESQDSTAIKTAEHRHPPLVRKIEADDRANLHVILGSISLSPEESHKSSSFKGPENQARDLDRELKISYKASKKLRIAFFPARDSSPPSFQHQETPNPEPLGSEQQPIPSVRRVEGEVKVDPDQPLIRYTGYDASSTDSPDQQDFKVYGPLRPGQDVYKEGIVRHFIAKKSRPADLPLPPPSPPSPLPPIRDKLPELKDTSYYEHSNDYGQSSDRQDPHPFDYKSYRARQSLSGEISFTKPEIGPIISRKTGKELESWQRKLLKKHQRKEARALLKLEGGGLIRKYRTGDKSEYELKQMEKRAERRRMRKERKESRGAKDGMTKKERKEERKARKKERRKALKVQREAKAAKKGMDYKEFMAKKTVQEIEEKKSKDELKEKLKLEKQRRLEMERRLEEQMGLEVKRRVALKLIEGEGKLAATIKMEALPKRRHALMAKLRKKTVAQVREEMRHKELELKPERDPDLDHQAKELFSPAKYQTLPRTIDLMVKKELKAKDEEERELEIQHDPVLANALGIGAKPISRGVKYAAEKLRRYEKALKIAKDIDETNAQGSETPPSPTPTPEDEVAHWAPIRHVELAKEDVELEEIIRNAQNKKNEGKDGDGKIAKNFFRVGSRGEGSRGLVRRKRAKLHINSRGMH